MVRRGGASCALSCGIPVSAQGFLSSNHRGLPAVAWRRLKVSSQDGAGADGCGSGRMSVAFPLAWLGPPLELLQTGGSPLRKARGPWTSTKEEPANDRPSLRSVLVQTSTRPSSALWCQVDSWQQQGHSHSKSKNLFSCKLSMKQFLGKGGPEVMLDDAV